MRFKWTEAESGLYVVRCDGSDRVIGCVARVRSGAWFVRVGMSGDAFNVESEADGKAKVEAAIIKPVAVAALRHGNVADPARNPNVARGLHNPVRGRVFATRPGS